jgi:hypothetical protein
MTTPYASATTGTKAREEIRGAWKSLKAQSEPQLFLQQV